MIRHTDATCFRRHGQAKLNAGEGHAVADSDVAPWIAAIKHEEDLASVNRTIAEVDKWQAAHFKEAGIRNKVKQAKKLYEDALREKVFRLLK